MRVVPARRMQHLGYLGGIALVYFLSGQVGMACIAQPERLAVVWPSSGVMLALLVLSRWRGQVLVTTFLTNLLINLMGGHTWATSLGFAGANALETGMAGWLLVRYLGTPLALGRVREVLGFVGIAVMGSNSLTALPGAAVPALAFGSSFWDLWRIWSIADGFGMLIVAPSILTWAALGKEVYKELTAQRLVESVCLFGMLGLVAHLVFGAQPDSGSFLLAFPYAVFPLLFWAALRLGPHGAATAALLLATVALWHTLEGLGPFALVHQSATARVLGIQVFLSVATLSSLAAAAVAKEHQQAGEDLRQHEGLLHSVINNTTTVIYVKGLDGRYLLANNQYEKVVQVRQQQVQGKTDYDLFPKDIADAFRINDLQVLRTGTACQAEEYAPHPDGLHTYISIKFPLFDAAGAPYALCGISTDITERKRDEERLQAALAEKETLLKEIHHRVKNNLQIVASLLNLQAKSTTAPELLASLLESRNRITTMALIHECLYGSADLSRVDVSLYLETLLTHLRQVYDAEARGLTLRCTCDEIALNLDTAIPCGLIVNELVSNALKHGFAEGQPGEVCVELRTQADDRFCLTVTDSGRGMPADFNVSQTTSLGLRLVHMLSGQLHGTLTLESHAGTAFTLHFAALHYKERM